jgi:hypothetical protein
MRQVVIGRLSIFSDLVHEHSAVISRLGLIDSATSSGEILADGPPEIIAES